MVLTFLFSSEWHKVFPVFLFQSFLLEVHEEVLAVKGAGGCFLGLVFLPESSWQQGTLVRQEVCPTDTLLPPSSAAHGEG